MVTWSTWSQAPGVSHTESSACSCFPTDWKCGSAPLANSAGTLSPLVSTPHLATRPSLRLLSLPFFSTGSLPRAAAVPLDGSEAIAAPSSPLSMCLSTILKASTLPSTKLSRSAQFLELPEWVSCRPHPVTGPFGRFHSRVFLASHTHSRHDGQGRTVHSPHGTTLPGRGRAPSETTMLPGFPLGKELPPVASNSHAQDYGPGQAKNQRLHPGLQQHLRLPGPLRQQPASGVGSPAGSPALKSAS